LTFPYIGLLRDNSCARQLRVFCFSGSSQAIFRNNAEDFLCPSQKAAARFGSSIHSLPGAPITRAETGEKSCTYMLSGIALGRGSLADVSVIRAWFVLRWPLPDACDAVGGAFGPPWREWPRSEYWASSVVRADLMRLLRRTTKHENRVQR
jgi:hypothetical protein